MKEIQTLSSTFGRFSSVVVRRVKISIIIMKFMSKTEHDFCDRNPLKGFKINSR